jgi:hypothetical protein
MFPAGLMLQGLTEESHIFIYAAIPSPPALR